MFRRLRLWLRQKFSYLALNDEDNSSDTEVEASGQCVEKGRSKLTFTEFVNSKRTVVTTRNAIENGYEFRTTLESHKSPEVVRGIILCDTKVRYFPVTIGKFSFLTTLKLSNNLIMEMPWSIIYLKHLEILDLSNNCLTELPPIIGYLSALNELLLNHNNLTFLPTGILKLTKLNVLDVTRNDNIKSPPVSICSQGKDAIFSELMRRHGRVNVFSGSMPWYNEDWSENTRVGLTEGVDTLMKLAIDCILECQIDYLSPLNVPPPLKTFLQTTEETRAKQIQICACSGCKGFFSTELLFNTHYCKPREGAFVQK